MFRPLQLQVERSTSPRSLLLSPTCYLDSDPCVSLCYLPVVLKRPFWLEFWPWLSTLKVLTQLKLAPGRGAVEPWSPTPTHLRLCNSCLPTRLASPPRPCLIWHWHSPDACTLTVDWICLADYLSMYLPRYLLRPQAQKPQEALT